jgi:hypothetical protein
VFAVGDGNKIKASKLETNSFQFHPLIICAARKKSKDYFCERRLSYWSFRSKLHFAHDVEMASIAFTISFNSETFAGKKYQGYGSSI